MSSRARCRVIRNIGCESVVSPRPGPYRSSLYIVKLGRRLVGTGEKVGVQSPLRNGTKLLCKSAVFVGVELVKADMSAGESKSPLSVRNNPMLEGEKRDD